MYYQDDLTGVYSPCYQCHEVERTVVHPHLYQHDPKIRQGTSPQYQYCYFDLVI